MEPTIQIRLINGETPSMEPKEEPYPCSFYTDGIQVTEQIPSKNSEEIVIVHPQAIFGVDQLQKALGGHTQAITSVRWSGINILFTSSRDRNIHVYDIRQINSCIKGRHIGQGYDPTERSGIDGAKKIR
ncbi:hypothetical protein QTN25_009178 [Entamoeba marina]